MGINSMISDEHTENEKIISSVQPLAGVLSQQDEANKQKARDFLTAYPELDTAQNRSMIDIVKSLPEGIQIGSIVRNRNFIKVDNKENIGKKYVAKYNGDEKKQVHIIHNHEDVIDQFSRREANNYAEKQ
jgi:hypothetical protein